MAAMEREGSRQLRERVELARLIIEAGVHPHTRDGSGRLPSAVAEAAGNNELARFFEHYLEVQACITLLRAKLGSSPLSCLPDDAFQVVFAHLVPSHLVSWTFANERREGQ